MTRVVGLIQDVFVLILKKKLFHLETFISQIGFLPIVRTTFKSIKLIMSHQVNPVQFNLKFKLGKKSSWEVINLTCRAKFNDIAKKFTTTMCKCCIILIFFKYNCIKIIRILFFLIKTCF